MVRSYADPMTDVTGQASFVPTGCENQAYAPAVSLTIDAGARLESVRSEATGDITTAQRVALILRDGTCSCRH